MSLLTGALLPSLSVGAVFVGGGKEGRNEPTTALPQLTNELAFNELAFIITFGIIDITSAIRAFATSAATHSLAAYSYPARK